jgi:lipid-A-disaccharide synthase-like uncharacterized protein
MTRTEVAEIFVFFWMMGLLGYTIRVAFKIFHEKPVA